MNWKLRLSVANAGTLASGQSQYELGRFGRYPSRHIASLGLAWGLVGPRGARVHPVTLHLSSVGGQTGSAP